MRTHNTPDGRSEVPQERQKIIVIGAGVIGLTSAITLQEAGYDVQIWAKDIPGETSKLASFWEPFNTVGDAKLRVREERWAKDTFEVLMKEIRQGIQGLSLMSGMVVFPAERDAPNWSEYVPSYENMTRQDIDEYGQIYGIKIPSNIRAGYYANYPSLDMVPYLEYLKGRFMLGGGRFKKRRIEDFSEPLQESNIVINSSGVGAKHLGDLSVYPTRGQLVKVTRPVTVDTIYCDDENPDGMVHIMPQSDHIMLGGTYEEKVNNMDVSSEISEAILRRCIQAIPALAHAQKISEHVGLRPSRKGGTRLEYENSELPVDTGEGESGSKFVVHNYGHGGNGLTYSWGCAKEVLELVRNANSAK